MATTKIKDQKGKRSVDGGWMEKICDCTHEREYAERQHTNAF
jgi:hypothetical protein